MAIEIEYDSSLDCIIMSATGVIKYKDLSTLANDLVSYKEFRTNINQLFDCRNGKLKLTTNDLKQIADDFTQITDILGQKRKLALVVSQDLHFGQMRQFEVFFQSGPGVFIQIFRSYDEAWSWISD